MDKTIVILMISVFALLIAVYIGVYIMEWRKDIRYLKSEVQRAYDRGEYKYWKRELFAVRLSILPGITPKMVKKLLRRFDK